MALQLVTNLTTTHHTLKNLNHNYLFKTAVPATVRDIITMRLVKKAKVQKTRWVLAPKRALITWLRFSEWVTKDLGKAALKTASRAIGLWFQKQLC